MVEHGKLSIRYSADLDVVFLMLLNRGKNVVECHKLFGIMYKCICYRRVLKKALRPEYEKTIRRYIQEWDNELNELIHAWCIGEQARQAIWDLVQASV